MIDSPSSNLPWCWLLPILEDAWQSVASVQLCVWVYLALFENWALIPIWYNTKVGLWSWGYKIAGRCLGSPLSTLRNSRDPSLRAPLANMVPRIEILEDRWCFLRKDLILLDVSEITQRWSWILAIGGFWTFLKFSPRVLEKSPHTGLGDNVIWKVQETRSWFSDDR